MQQVTILRRDHILRPSPSGEPTDVVEVAYSVPYHLPRYVYLPQEIYRAATAEELQVNSRYQMVPVNEPAAAAERQAIQTDIKAAIASVPQTIELP